ncbi:uncharacterized protein TNCV_4158331 [Trichonephila clavipes]|nr:uncharacterized protein TNCV_4158331 [Trichonephila clavipes]
MDLTPFTAKGLQLNSSLSSPSPSHKFKRVSINSKLFYAQRKFPLRTLTDADVAGDHTDSGTGGRCIVSNGTPCHHSSCGSDASLQSKGRIEAFTTGSPHTNTIVITSERESGFVTKDDLVPFRCSLISSCVAPLQTEASMGGHQGQHRNGRDPKCPSARRLCMVREDTWAPNEGATCKWMADDEASRCTIAFLTMWRSSRRLVCLGRPEPGLRVNDISRNH